MKKDEGIEHTGKEGRKEGRKEKKEKKKHVGMNEQNSWNKGLKETMTEVDEYNELER